MKKIILGALILIVSCSPSKRLEQQQQKAVNTVLADVDLVNKVGNVWARSNPCINDTEKIPIPFPTYIKGKDSIVYRNKDSIVNRFLYIPKDNKIPRPLSFDTLISYKIRVDTIIKQVPIYVTDMREVNSLRGQLSVKNDSLEKVTGLYNSLWQNQKSLSYSFNLLLKNLIKKWWFWLIVVAFVLYIFRSHIILPKIPTIKI